MQVFNNIPAFSVFRNYTHSVSNLRKSMSRLSSGLRIEKAGDDPAGLAMSERLRAQMRNTSAAASNVENKINYLQTADGWLQKIQDMISRMNELAVMANDGTKSKTDRDNLQREFEQMQKEIQRITTGATAAGKFNGLYLFRGGTGEASKEGDLVVGFPTRARGVTSVIGHDGSTMTAATWTATYDEIAETWTFRNVTTGTVESVVSARPDEGVDVALEGVYGFRFVIDAPKKGTFGTNDVFRWTNVPYVAPTGGVTSFINRGVTGASGTSTMLGTGSGVSTAEWSATYDAVAQLWTVRNETTATDVTTIAAAPNGGGFVNLEGPNGFRYTIAAPASGTYATGDRFAWTNTAYVPPPLGSPVLTDDRTPTQGSASATLLGDGTDLTTASWRATYDSVSRLWTVRNLTTATDIGTIAAAPNGGGSILQIGGANGFDLVINAPGGGTEYTNGDVFNWTTQAYVAPVLSGTSFIDNQTPTAGSATTSAQGDGSGISTADWSASYNSVTRLWTVRNETTATDVGTIAAVPNAGGSLNLEGANGFSVNIAVPAGGTQYTLGDRFTWSTTAYVPPSVGVPSYTDTGDPTTGSASTSQAGNGSGISTSAWSAVYDADTQEWTIRNETTGQDMGTITADPDSGGALLLEGANGFTFTLDAPSSGSYNTGDRFDWSNTAAVAANTGSPLLHDNTDPTVGTSGAAQLGDGESITTASWRATYDAVAQLWTVRNITTNLNVGTIAAAPNAGGFIDLQGPNGFRYTINAPTSGVYNTGDRFTWNNTAHVDWRAGPTTFVDSTTPTTATSGTSQLGDGTSVTSSQWRATYDAIALQWTIRNVTSGANVGTIAAAPNAGGFIDLQGPNGFRYTINAPTGGVYNTGDRFTWSNTAHTPPVLPTSTFTQAPAPPVTATVTFQEDGYDVTSATWRATYDTMAQEWTIRNMTTGFVYGTIAAAPNGGATRANLEGTSGFTLDIAAPASGSYSTGDYFEWSNVEHIGAIPGVADFQDFSTLQVSLQVGPDSNQIFKEANIVLEADAFHVIGSYTTYRYGSVNMTLLGSASRAVTWASLICPAHLKIDEQSLAQAAVDKLNLGTDYLSSIRSVVGAEMNRMEQTLSGLRNYEENIRATESRIRDVDVARETMTFAKYQILTQIGTAILAQANALTGSVLQLVG